MADSLHVIQLPHPLKVNKPLPVQEPVAFMQYFLISLILLIVLASEDGNFEKKRSKGRKDTDRDGNEVDVEAPDIQFENQIYDESYEAPPPKPVTTSSKKPILVTQTTNNQGQVTSSKGSSNTSGVKTEISNKYVTVYPTIQAPRMEGNAHDQKHPYIFTLVALSVVIMFLGYL